MRVRRRLQHPAAERHAEFLAEFLGQGDGLYRGLGCGAGRTVIGLDYSTDQLRVAARSGHPLLRTTPPRCRSPWW